MAELFRLVKYYNLPRYMGFFKCIPVVPHNAVAEGSKIRSYRRGELLMHEWQSERMNPKVAEAVSFSLFVSLSVSSSLCGSLSLSLYLSVYLVDYLSS